MNRFPSLHVVCVHVLFLYVSQQPLFIQYSHQNVQMYVFGVRDLNDSFVLFPTDLFKKYFTDGALSFLGGQLTQQSPPPEISSPPANVKGSTKLSFLGVYYHGFVKVPYGDAGSPGNINSAE